MQGRETREAARRRLHSHRVPPAGRWSVSGTEGEFLDKPGGGFFRSLLQDRNRPCGTVEAVEHEEIGPVASVVASLRVLSFRDSNDRNINGTAARMQTIKVRYRTDEAGARLIAELRRVQSSAIRCAYVSAVRADGTKRPEKEIREIVKARHTREGVLDSWAMHSATRLGVMKRKHCPEGDMVFGGKANLERRRKGLISSGEWKALRLLPFVSYGDSQKPRGNQNIHLIGETELVVKIGRKEGGGRGGRTVTAHATLTLAGMTGNAGRIVREIAAVSANHDRKQRVNVTYSIDETHVSITIDPADLPDHPERKALFRVASGRCLGIDLNPKWIGLSLVENRGDPRDLAQTSVLDHGLVELAMPEGSNAMMMRETLAAVCGRAVSMARKWGAGVIAVEKGLGKLRSSGRSRDNNRSLNYWARTILVSMLRRKAALAGITVIEVWSGYSTTIGNLAFELPDACAAGAEIARRGLSARAGLKDVLPLLDEAWLADRRKDLPLRVELGSWRDVHRTIKAAKTIGYRRPHPTVPNGTAGSDAHGTVTSSGHAVVRLGLRRRPGILFRSQHAARIEPDGSASQRMAKRRASGSTTAYAT